MKELRCYKKGMYLLLVLAFLPGFDLKAQSTDTLKIPGQKKTQWLVGLDTYSALSPLSIIAGFETSCGYRFSVSVSHWKRSSRVGAFFNYQISKKHKVSIGISYHESYLLYKFKQNRAEYIDSLISNRYHLTTVDVAFYPGFYEVRRQHFFNLSLSKEFQIYKHINLNLRVSAVYGVNDYYGYRELVPIGGVQLYYKW